MNYKYTIAKCIVFSSLTNIKNFGCECCRYRKNNYTGSYKKNNYIKTNIDQKRSKFFNANDLKDDTYKAKVEELKSCISNEIKTIITNEEKLNEVINSLETNTTTGIPNKGNTCYLNASIQLLTHLGDLVKLVATKLKENIGNADSLKKMPLSMSFFRLCYAIYCENKSVETTYRIDPEIYNTLYFFIFKKGLGFENNRRYEGFKIPKMNDASEFITEFLNDILVELGIYNQNRVDNNNMISILSTEEIKCNKCNKTKPKKNTVYNSKSVILGGCADNAKLNTLLKFNENDKINVNCETNGCNSVTGTKQTKWTAPINNLYVLFDLKRFNDFGNKIYTKIDIDDQINFNDKNYNLHSVIVQEGNTGVGHYVYYAKINNKWYKFNDDKVRELTSENGKKNIKDGYIVAYKKS